MIADAHPPPQSLPLARAKASPTNVRLVSTATITINDLIRRSQLAEFWTTHAKLLLGHPITAGEEEHYLNLAPSPLGTSNSPSRSDDARRLVLPGVIPRRSWSGVPARAYQANRTKHIAEAAIAAKGAEQRRAARKVRSACKRTLPHNSKKKRDD